MPLNNGAVNEIQSFAIDGSTSSGDLITLSEYKTHNSRKHGYQPGAVLRAIVNRHARQTSHMAAGIAQFIANRTVAGVVDDGNLDKVETGLESSIISVMTNTLANSNVITKIKTSGTASSTGFTLVDDTDIAAIFTKISDFKVATTGTGNFVKSLALSTANNKITITQTLGTVAYCTYCAASTYCSYCSYCNYCGYCSYCSYCNCYCD